MISPDRLLSVFSKFVDAPPLESAPAAWTLAMSNGQPHSIRARLDGDTLELVTGPLPRDLPPACMLRANLALPPPSRLVVTASDALLLRAEIVLDENTQCDTVLAAALAALRAGLDAAAGAPLPTLPTNEEPWDIERTAAEAGFEARPAAAGRYRVEFPERRSRAAFVGPGLTAEMEMLPPGEYPDPVRQAVATFLLRATSVIRFVRAAGGAEGGARLEVRFPAPPAPARMESAMLALSLAGPRQEDVSVLTREDAARMYLAVCSHSISKGGDG